MSLSVSSNRIKSSSRSNLTNVWPFVKQTQVRTWPEKKAVSFKRFQSLYKAKDEADKYIHHSRLLFSGSATMHRVFHDAYGCAYMASYKGNKPDMSQLMTHGNVTLTHFHIFTYSTATESSPEFENDVFNSIKRCINKRQWAWEWGE